MSENGKTLCPCSASQHRCGRAKHFVFSWSASNIRGQLGLAQQSRKYQANIITKARMWIVRAWQSEDVALYGKVGDPPPLLIANSV